MVGWSLFAFAGMWLTRRDGIARVCALASLPLIVVMWAWTFYANFTQDGGSWARVPLFNPLDLVLAVVYALAASWFVRARKLGWSFDKYRVELLSAAGATAFLWLNAILLRTLHHWAGVPYELGAMAESTLVQASVSVYWTLCALAITIWATRRGLRPLWFVGAALLALTVVKLFLFDLSHVTGIERIVSFIGIGVLLLLIGYFSPLPPKPPRRRTTRHETTRRPARTEPAHVVRGGRRARRAALSLDLDGTAAYYQLTVPQPVYAASRRDDLGDVRIFNGAGEPVPYSLDAPTAAAPPSRPSARRCTGFRCRPPAPTTATRRSA